jgi:hypothetical protein
MQRSKFARLGLALAAVLIVAICPAVSAEAGAGARPETGASITTGVLAIPQLLWEQLAALLIPSNREQPGLTGLAGTSAHKRSAADEPKGGSRADSDENEAGSSIDPDG